MSTKEKILLGCVIYAVGVGLLSLVSPEGKLLALSSVAAAVAYIFLLLAWREDL